MTDHELAISWLSAVKQPRIALELETVYQLIADQVQARAPVCEVSGRCCHFEAYGHRLYVSGLEAAYTVAHLADTLTRGLVEAAQTRGDCPFLVEERCAAHTIKPMGCQVYYCDPTAQEWQQQLSERVLAMIRKIHDRYGLEYRYGEWRGMLTMFAAS